MKQKKFAGLTENHLCLRTSKIANLDSGTMVEAFKYLNYRQLAMNSLVSQRFRSVIETHRHQLALLYVTICMEQRYGNRPAAIKISNKELSPKEYKEWVARNDYSKRSKRMLLKGQAEENGYKLSASGHYNGPIGESTYVFFATVKELNHKTWPLFQHFVRLLSDPFVFIGNLELIPQDDIFNLLATTIDGSNHGRLQCQKLEINFGSKAEKTFNWIKGHMRCVSFQIAISESSANRDQELLDFFASGSDFTSKVAVIYSPISKEVVVDTVQKFMDLKSCDENKIVRSIRAKISKSTAEALKSNYAKFFIKEKKYHRGFTTEHVFKFLNVDTGKKLQLTITSSRLYEEMYFGEGQEPLEEVYIVNL